jgi:hypothetical protein
VLPPEGAASEVGALAMVDTTPYYGPLAPDDPNAYEDPKSPTAGWWLGGAALLIVLAVAAAVVWASWQGGGSHGASGG